MKYLQSYNSTSSSTFPMTCRSGSSLKKTICHSTRHFLKGKPLAKRVIIIVITRWYSSVSSLSGKVPPPYLFLSIVITFVFQFGESLIIIMDSDKLQAMNWIEWTSDLASGQHVLLTEPCVQLLARVTVKCHWFKSSHLKKNIFVKSLIFYLVED